LPPPPSQSQQQQQYHPDAVQLKDDDDLKLLPLIGTILEMTDALQNPQQTPFSNKIHFRRRILALIKEGQEIVSEFRPVTTTVSESGTPSLRLDVFPDATYYDFVGRDDFYDLLDQDAEGGDEFDDAEVQKAVTIAKAYCLSDALVADQCLKVIEDVSEGLAKLLLKTHDLVGKVVSDQKKSSTSESVRSRMQEITRIHEVANSLSKGVIGVGAAIYPESLDVGDDSQGLEVIITGYILLINDALGMVRETGLGLDDGEEIVAESGLISKDVEGRLSPIVDFITKSRDLQLLHAE
jgi:hypothetical protein